jgi:hypothetical protein
MRTSARLLFGLALVAAAGCQQQAPASKLDTRPPAKVNLPPVPPPEAFDLVEKNTTGDWTAAGLRKHRTELFGQPVVVEGRVVEAYRCGANEGSLKEGAVVTVTGTMQKAVEGFTLSEEGVIADASFKAASK